jgi:hypothetical protein
MPPSSLRHGPTPGMDGSDWLAARIRRAWLRHGTFFGAWVYFPWVCAIRARPKVPATLKRTAMAILGSIRVSRMSQPGNDAITLYS